MGFKDYLRHYLSVPGFLFFFVISFAIVCVIHGILMARARKMAGKYRESDRGYAMYDLFCIQSEQYYELIFSSTAILFFTGIYFLIDFDYFHLSAQWWAFWEKYNDFLLLGFLILSIIMINVLDHFLIPLHKVNESETAALRMGSMIYMLVIFAYIKFIYEDDNYDIIIFYFITMLISRFVYLDASFDGFRQSMRAFLNMLPILMLVLLSTGLLALYGFGSGYLLKANGVVVSLFLAHCFVIAEIFLLTVTGINKRVARRISKRVTGRPHR